MNASRTNSQPCPYSGEKLQTKEWPSFLEIKGRVRFDAFEKFLQQLPLSRSRAIMVLSIYMIYCSSHSPSQCSVDKCSLYLFSSSQYMFKCYHARNLKAVKNNQLMCSLLRISFLLVMLYYISKSHTECNYFTTATTITRFQQVITK